MPLPLFDPVALPIESVSSDPPLAGAQLSVETLRHCFVDPRSWTPETNDEQRFRRFNGTMTNASVLIPLVDRGDQITVLFTQRTAHLHDHAGQVSFPGGRAEPEDRSVEETALRESLEEIGLAREHIELLGVLPEYPTGTGYRVSPVVALVHPPFELTIDSFEVAEVFEVPLAFLMDPANHQIRRIALEQGERKFFSMPYERHFIWGATAGMLRNFYRFLAAQLAA